MPIKVIHISADNSGGAARAALRLHQSFVVNENFSSRMIVGVKTISDWRVLSLTGFWNKVLRKISIILDSLLLRLFIRDHRVPRSCSTLGAVTADYINNLDCDVVNLHWIGSGFLSIEEIGKIKKPTVWTLHDMWAFCGAEHLSTDEINSGWRTGYRESEGNFFQFKLDKWVWKRKKKSWKRPIQIVTPSRWLAECVNSSKLMKDWDVTVIPNGLDLQKYKPVDQSIARQILGFSSDSKLILFGAIKGTALPYKGWDLLEVTLRNLSLTSPEVEVIILGEDQPQNPPFIDLKMHWMGHLYDDYTLSLIYSASDLLVVPSRQESFCQTASEAQACGCPVVAFKATGLLDVVDHKVTGYLAKPFCVDDLKYGIEWVLMNKEALDMSKNSRKRAQNLWSYQRVSNKYFDLYRKIIC
jgi:glycosyltransferase involved in cell wall biosynthesis